MITGTVAYQVKYSHRRSIGIIVSPDDGVIVRAPYRTPSHVIEKFVSSKSAWINKHLDNYSGMIRLSDLKPLIEKSSAHIASKLEELLTRYSAYGFSVSALSVRRMKRRWGSCSSKGKITINSELLKLDERYLEYVILHELCHLRHHNHSQAYYNLLSEVYPNWKETRKELRKYIT